MARETEDNTGAANTDAKRPVVRRVIRKVDFYWSDRWRRVINIYRCPECGKEMSDLNARKPKLNRDHVCV